MYLDLVTDETFGPQHTHIMAQAYYILFAAVTLFILYYRRQIRKYQERQVRFGLIWSTNCRFIRSSGSEDIRGATWMSTSASNSEPETVGRGSTGADLSR